MSDDKDDCTDKSPNKRKVEIKDWKPHFKILVWNNGVVEGMRNSTRMLDGCWDLECQVKTFNWLRVWGTRFLKVLKTFFPKCVIYRTELSIRLYSNVCHSQAMDIAMVS